MTALINPITGLTYTQEKLLSGLMAWTSNPRILQVMKDLRRLSLNQAIILSHRIRATIHPQEPPPRGVKPLTAEETAICVLQFIDNGKVRKVIAREASRISDAGPAKRIIRDLVTLKRDLYDEYKIEQKQAEAHYREALQERSGLVLPN